MARDILSEYGPNYRGSKVPKGNSGLAHDGGKCVCRDVHNYQTPVGPINHSIGPGIGEVEPRHGQAGERLGEPGEREFTGSPGIHGVNHGNKGSQGRH